MFGDLLKELIEEKYNTQANFADACNIPRSTVSDVVTNKKLPREKSLKKYIQALEPLSETTKKALIREWAFGKSKGKLRKEVEELETENKNMLDVLKTVKKEKELLSEIKDLKEYESFYNLFFENLNPAETKLVLKAMEKELKLIALEKNKLNEFEEKFKTLDTLIENIM